MRTCAIPPPTGRSPGRPSLRAVNRNELLDSLYEKYLEAENSATFIRQVGQRYSVSTLERLAESGDRMSVEHYVGVT